MNNELADGWDSHLLELEASAQEDGKGLATRKSSMLCIAELAKRIPEFLGGSADLTGSNLTRWPEAREDQHLSYGVREFAMTAMGNGIALHGGLIPFSGTFLVFMEYARNAVRLAALMKVRNIFVYTHDSVALGEDGPTHQPVEQLTSLRTTPDLSTWRPCDTVESAFAWRSAVAGSRPTALIFTRQTTPCQPRNQEAYQNIARGGYVLVEPASAPEAIIIATGSEVQLAVDAAQTLAATGTAVRVVSMPCVDVFLSQDAAYQEEVLPSSVTARVAVEAAHPDYWYKFVGLQGAVVGIDRFGLSAPGEVAMAELGMTIDNVVSIVRQVVGGE
jgi:transketolase